MNPYSVYVRSPVDNYDYINIQSFDNSFLSNYSRYNDFFTMFRNNVYNNINNNNNRNNNFNTSLNYEHIASSVRNTEIAVISEGSSMFTSDQSANYFSEDEEEDDDDYYDDDYYDDDYDDDDDEDYADDDFL